VTSAVTLSIDFGYKNIGLALVRNQEGVNTPLFAGTLQYDPFALSKKVGPRAQLRRGRRTRKTKRYRLNSLKKALSNLNLSEEGIHQLVNFCRRRGYSSLFEPRAVSTDRGTQPEEEIVFRFSREEFFAALEKEIERLFPEEQRGSVLAICEKILNRAGEPSQEIRPLRIDNRGASRCAWDGCDNVPPRRDNALRDPLSQLVHTVFASSLRGDTALQQEVSGMLDRIAELGKRLRHRGGPDPDKERKALKAEIGEELKLLKKLYGLNPDLTEETATPWTKIRQNITNLIEQTGGRNRFCRYHSSQYVTHFMEGKPIPFKATLTERDLVSRREEILFQKIWRYIEARILPLAPDGINHVIVERTAIDLLAGSRKQRQDIMNKEALEEMYQRGPRYGFTDDLDMLRGEFGGLCAYCGQEHAELVERDHLLPRSKFFFDSYLNIVPACPNCNRSQKQAASPEQSALHIHENAYDAYSRYYDSIRENPPHVFHTIKKGILNLMRDPTRTWEVERFLSLIANQFAQVTGTQRGPRPLARYLSGKIYQKYGEKPRIGFVNGRHTALWRKAAYPDFDKFRDKAEGGVVNHALDALLMACDLPDLTSLEARNLQPSLMQWWVNKVKKAAPPEGPEGIPELPEPNFAVPGFENLLPGNYVEVDLAKMNWNHKDSKVQRQGAYGWSIQEDLPVQRVTAASLADEIRQADKKKTPESRKSEVKKAVNLVVHPRLRKALEQANNGNTPGAITGEALKTWLRKSIKGNLDKAHFSSHPADQRRAKMLQDFLSGQSEGIPAVIGVNTFVPSLKSNTDLNRINPATGHVIHRYVADPANVAYIVAYQKKNGKVKRDKPLTLEWRQSGAVISDSRLFKEVREKPLMGRALGERATDQTAWKTALRHYLTSAGIAEYNFVSQGNVVVYEDGSERYVRNFSGSYGFRKSWFKGMTAVRPSPLTKRLIPNATL